MYIVFKKKDFTYIIYKYLCNFISLLQSKFINYNYSLFYIFYPIIMDEDYYQQREGNHYQQNAWSTGVNVALSIWIAVAVVVSWEYNHSIWYAILHWFFNYFYLIYHWLTY